MGFTDVTTHRYDPVNKEDDDLNHEPQPIIVHVSTPWWKIFLCNLIAAAFGAGVTLLVARGTLMPQQSSQSATSAAAAVVATTSTSSVALIVPTPSIERVNMNVFPNELDGVILDCGHSPETAREKGCVYDVMMQDWVPEPCYDAVLTERYLAKGNYTWYADGDGNTTLTNDAMAKGEHGRAWMSTSYHKDHCVFSWLKIVRALRTNRAISQELLSYDHVLHCAHGALKANEDSTDLGVSAPTNYAKCALYTTWREDFVPDKHDSSSR